MQLRTRLVNSIESYLKFFEIKVIFQSPCQLYLNRKRSDLTLFTDTCQVTARLLIMVKHNATFLLGLQSIWVFLM